MVRGLDAVELQTVSLKGELRRRAHGIGPVLGRLGATRTAAGPSAVVGVSLRIRPARIGVVDDHVSAGACLRERMERHQRSKAAYACDRCQQHPSPPMSIQIPSHRIPPFLWGRSNSARPFVRPARRSILQTFCHCRKRVAAIRNIMGRPSRQRIDRRCERCSSSLGQIDWYAHSIPKARDAKGRLPKQTPLSSNRIQRSAKVSDRRRLAGEAITTARPARETPRERMGRSHDMRRRLRERRGSRS